MQTVDIAIFVEVYRGNESVHLYSRPRSSSYSFALCFSTSASGHRRQLVRGFWPTPAKDTASNRVDPSMSPPVGAVSARSNGLGDEIKAIRGHRYSSVWTVRVCFERKCASNYTIRYDTIRDAILTCARKPTRVSLIYRTETTTKKCTTEKCKTD